MDKTLLPAGDIKILKDISKIEKAFNLGDDTTKAFLRDMILTDESYLETSNLVRRKIIDISFVPVYITRGCFSNRLHTPLTISQINGFNKGVFFNLGTPINLLIDAAVILDIRNNFYNEYLSNNTIDQILSDNNYPYVDHKLDMKIAASWICSTDSDKNVVLFKLINDKLTELGNVYTF